jgi:putative ABC transport system permease protein
LAADGSAIISESDFFRFIPGYSIDEVGLGLVRLLPGTDPAAVRQQIQGILRPAAARVDVSAAADTAPARPTDAPVDVLTRQQVRQSETAYWMFKTPVGFIFIAGVVVAFVVGAIIVYIVLSFDIARQIREYATLKAMGYRNAFLARTVLEQALMLAVLSYVLAFGVSLLLYEIVGSAAKLPISMTGVRQVIVFSSALGMSLVSALVAMQKLRKADPADLF